MKHTKKTKKITCLALCSLMACSAVSFVACSDEREVDESKTQLNIAVYNGAMGTEWMEKIGAEFEERYADVSFESGKTGVQVWVDGGKDEFSDTNLITSMPDGDYDVYFTQNISYLKAAVDAQVFMNINDVISEKYDVVDFGDGEKAYSILDKMDKGSVNYFGLEQNGTKNYYSIGWMAPVHGIVYDVDLFCEKGFYFLADGSLGGSLDRETDVLSAGPNGETGDYDDGLPATWEQMKELLAYMRDNEVTPFTWSGQYVYQRNNFFDAVWASYEGYDDYMLNYSMNGKTMINGEEVTITPQTGYKIAAQEGKLAALTAIRDIVSNSKNYSNQAFYSSQSHTGAEREYLLSSYENEPIAMLIEANYWENEAAEYFKEMASEYDEKWSQANRRFGMMPIPKFIGTAGVPDQTNTDTVINTNAYMLAGINKYTDSEKAAKEFFKFAHTNEMLSLATGLTGISRGFKMKMNNEDWNKMSYCQQQTYQLQHDERTVVVNKSMPENPDFGYGNTIVKYWDREISYNGTVYSDLFKNFADMNQNGTPLSPKALFDTYAQHNTAATWSIK